MLGEKDSCIICMMYYGDSRHYGLHEHHIFEGGTSGRRSTSDKYDLTVMLCPIHHRELHQHPNTGIDQMLKQMGQKYYEEHYGNRDDFCRDFIKSYL